MARDVTVQVHYQPDRSMRVTVVGPAGPVDVGSTRVSADVGRIAKAGVRAVFGSEAVSFALSGNRPPWLQEGMIVRLPPEDMDGMSHPYAQVVGFLPIGGVIVVHPESSAGIYDPELLTPVDPAQVPPETLHEIVLKTERPAWQP